MSKEILNRREDIYAHGVPPDILKPSDVIGIVKESFAALSLSKTSYTALRTSLGSPVRYYADVELPDGPGEGGTLKYKVARVYFAPVRYADAIEFYATVTATNVQSNSGVMVLRLTAAPGDTPAARLAAPITNFMQ